MTRRQTPPQAARAARVLGELFARHVGLIMEQDGLPRGAAALRAMIEGGAGLIRRETEHPTPPASKDAPASPKGTKP